MALDTMIASERRREEACMGELSMTEEPIYMWEIFTRQLLPEKCGIVSHGNRRYSFRHELQDPQAKDGFASADCRGEPACAIGAPAAPAGAAMHPWRHDISSAGSAVA